MQAKQIEAAVAKDMKDTKALCTKAFNTITKKLEDKYHQMEELNKKYQQVGMYQPTAERKLLHNQPDLPNLG